MVFLKLVSPENDKGQWIDIGTDPDNTLPVRLKLRRIPEKVAREIEAKYGTLETVQLPVKTTEADGTTREFSNVSKHRVYSAADHRLINRDKAEYAVIDSENLTASAGDEAQASVLSSLLGGVPVKAGETVSFDGNLTQAAKHHFFDNDWQLALAVVTKHNDLYEREYGKETRLAKT